jgi:DNA repair exonuclease SbcCD ATPase subunit
MIVVTRIQVENMRGTAATSVPVEPVMLYVGPNGSGKTAIIGGLAYALTGRFPGVASTTAADLRAMAVDPKKPMRVIVRGQTDGQHFEVQRGVSADGEHGLFVHVGSKASKTKREAEQALAKHFGNVQWSLDAFDPAREDGIWRISAEKRKAWAHDLCASASGWTVERLGKALGPEAWSELIWTTNDMSPGQLVEAGIERLTRRLRDLQAVVREARTVAEGVATPTDVPSAAEVEAADAAYEGAFARVRDLERDLRDVQTKATTIQRNRRERKRLGDSIAAAQKAYDETRPPETDPKAVFPDHVRLDDLESALLALEMDITDARDEALAAQNWVAFNRALLVAAEQASKNAECPVCGGAPGQNIEPSIKSRERTWIEQRDIAVQKDIAVDKLVLRRRTIDAEAQTLRIARAVHERLSAADRSDHDRFHATWRALLTNIKTMQDQLAELAADEPEPDASGVQAALVAARVAHAAAKSRVQEMRSRIALAREREAQLTAAAYADKKVDLVKRMLAQLREVRDQMLADAVKPLQGALDKLQALAHGGVRWHLRTGERGLQMGVVRTFDRMFVPVEALSAGEKYRATIALVVAAAMVRREPWVGLFLDDIELLHPPSERVSVLRALVTVQKAGFVDNVLAAGACEAPALPIEGLGVIEMPRVAAPAEMDETHGDAWGLSGDATP